MVESSSGFVVCGKSLKQLTMYYKSCLLIAHSTVAVLLVTLTLPVQPVLAQTKDYGYPLEAGQISYIFTHNTEDGLETPLTEGRRPAWSPDGTRIAFYRPAADPRQGDMFLINSDGSGLIWLGTGVEPDWSPDGEHIVFVSGDGIAVREVGDPFFVTILEHRFMAGTDRESGGGDYGEYDWGVGRPAWSPDGAQIAFEHLGAPDWLEPRIWVMNADGTGIRLLTPFSIYGHPESGPSWSPESSRIAMFSSLNGLEIFHLADGFRDSLLKTYITPHLFHGAKPTWAPTGDRLAFSGIYPSTGGPEIWLIQADGSSAHALTTNAYEPDWAPNQPRIAFVSNISGLTSYVPKGPVKEPDEPKDPPPKIPKEPQIKLPKCNTNCASPNGLSKARTRDGL